ncbi:acyl-CoA dehydrogenase family protein [Arsenicicoccus bolidensis]|uniref:acyl-CoA dehydrogenase family protein n=1 Tax=Arsenicicoccus bolidensis TaxID=229480 RepID=UPI0028AAA4AC|nr:acyl-CoA dehydrogenase family protein [Arsenicicoccus bolidensis]
MTSRTPAPGGLDHETRASLADSLTKLFADNTSGPSVGAALDALGWSEVEAEDAATATSLLFRAQGSALASTNALSDSMLRFLGGGLPAAERQTTLLLPHPDDDAARPGARERVGVRGLLLDTPSPDALVLVPGCHGERVLLRPVPATWITERCGPSAGFDPGSRWLLLDTEDPVPESADRSWDAQAVDWTAGLALGRLALSSEILGVCDAALRTAVQHVTTRHQYGRAIGSFQAVRHRLAEAHVAIESASFLLDAAWAVLMSEASPEAPTGWAAAAAKARAGRAQAEVMRTGIQVLGAMGLTMESPMHRHVTRAAALDLLLGGQARLEESLGDSLLTGTAAYPIASI